MTTKAHKKYTKSKLCGEPISSPQKVPSLGQTVKIVAITIIKSIAKKYKA
jgi:hypothetical protein